MDITSVSVGYSRKLSDGTFGSEEVSVAYTASVAEGQSVLHLTHQLVHQGRDAALALLQASDSAAVRRAAGAMSERERRYDAYQTARMDAERDAQRYVSKPDAPDVDEEDHPDQGGL